MLLASLIAGFAIFEVLAVRYGAESRPVFDERRAHQRLARQR